MLERINFPKDIRQSSIEELKILAEEIRRVIIDTVSKKGGHLASSLGAVELCLAIHYCANTPKDTLIFDVGHQAYAHKIITGRKNLFAKLREYKGISGFPNPEESNYDVYISGHASTAISWGQGIAEAKRLKKDTSKTIVVIGDGSLTGGMCFEALNNCGHSKSDVLVIFNHNEMSISYSTGSLVHYLNKIISLPIYNRIKKELDNFLTHLPSFAYRLVKKAKKFEEAIKGLIVPGIFFEELGFRYFGPLDGHNLNLLIPTLNNILSLKGPRLLHVITKKGKGYSFSENNPEEFHSVLPFSVSTGKPIRLIKEGFGEVMAKKLVSLGKENQRIVAITAAMAKGTGLNIFSQAFPERFWDVGIAEEHAVGLASGLARAGFRPFVAIYSTFLQRSFDQIVHDVALQKLPVVFCVDRAGFVGEDGPTHHGVFDISYLRIIPNMICMAPKDKLELEDMLEFSLTIDLPCSIRYPKGESYVLGKKRSNIGLGKSEILCEGKDICIIALGSMVKEAYEAVNLLQDKGLSVFFVNARFIKPLDEELLDFIGANFKFVVTVEEGILNGGFGSAILEFYERRDCLGRLNIKRLGITDEFSTFASREQLLEIYGLDSKSIAKRVLDIFKEESILSFSYSRKR
ncbi:MAG: 1-deoxy-D-xylulose-5-phosphate synthase [Candidatus Omnitrophica bacterium]|nr:1-deoxy-D-xylulose-5-phosphate synthase [Candidatus Omnitrophota bacterium]MCM8826461.1 1-deoxy-D-xylulose-5-phosphate synthase [Candidatus Omnitrophota bacterium]